MKNVKVLVIFLLLISVCASGCIWGGIRDLGNSTPASSIILNPRVLASDTITTTTITVTVLSNGAPSANKEVTLSENFGLVISPASGLTDAAGIVTFTARTSNSGVSGTASITATNNTDNTDVGTTSLKIYDSTFLSTIAGLTLWLRADTISGLTNGATVSNWPDLSGNGNNAFQGVALKRPIWLTNSLNDLAVVRFDGIDDLLTLTTRQLSLRSIFLVHKWSASAGAANRTLIGDTLNPNFLGGAVIQILNAGASASVTGGTTYLDTVLVNPTITNHITSYGQVNFITTANVQFAQIGQDRAVAGTFFWGDLAEIATYNNAVSAVDRMRIENYFRDKYGF